MAIPFCAVTVQVGSRIANGMSVRPGIAKDPQDQGIGLGQLVSVHDQQATRFRQ